METNQEKLDFLHTFGCQMFSTGRQTIVSLYIFVRVFQWNGFIFQQIYCKNCLRTFI
jgi:hypothetical protein